MTRLRRTFTLALTLFFAWVGILALMAGFAGEPPRPRVSAAATP